jgi:hypothetical protein
MNLNRLQVAYILLPIVILVIAKHSGLANVQTKIPTIDVSATGKANYGEGHAPSDTYHSLICTWETTDADTVSIIGPAADIRGDLKPSGTIELPVGNYIFIASGPGGVAFTPVGGQVTSRRGPGLDGLVYSFKDQFNPDVFSSYAYKTEVVPKSGVDSKASIINYLQTLGYNASSADSAPAKIPDGTFIYTPNYNYHELLKQSPEDQAMRGELRRQAALIVMLRPRKEPERKNVYDLYVLGLVQRNRQRQDNKWSFDPDGFQLALPLCKLVADNIGRILRQ